jgi:signal transduction histidine kinase
MVKPNKPSELEAKLIELEQVLEALRNEDVDAVVGKHNILLLRLKETEDELSKHRDYLEQLVIQRTQELEQANEQLKQFAHRIAQVQEEERKRIAYELHDDTAQYLALLKLELDSILQSGEIQSPKILEKLQYLNRDAGRAVDDVRRYSHELRPAVLDNMGLQAALEQIVDDTNKLKQIEAELKMEGEEANLTDEMKLGLFRIAQEALNNARKHARESKVTIALKFSKKQLRMTISDNGPGFDTNEARARAGKKGSLGLLSMQERANLIGANLNIESNPGKGTIVRAEVKL